MSVTEEQVEAAARAMRIEEFSDITPEGFTARQWDTGETSPEIKEKYRRMVRAALSAAPPAAPVSREAIDLALGEVLWNSANHPSPVAVLGRDTAPLRNKCVDAVMRALPKGTRTEEQVIQEFLEKRDTPVLRFETTDAQDGLIRMMESSLRLQLATAIEAKRDLIVPPDNRSSTGVLLRQAFNDCIEIVRTLGQVAPEEKKS